MAGQTVEAIESAIDDDKLDPKRGGHSAAAIEPGS
jgi:hypothetical protein